MKIEREIFDNDKFIIHVNYRKNDIDKIRNKLKDAENSELHPTRDIPLSGDNLGSDDDHEAVDNVLSAR